MGFSKDFIWGAATASYQVEGAAYEDGKGLNIWDVFCKEENSHVYSMNNGDVACDQYHRYKEDVAIMKEIGLKAYRFSVDWARVMPDGTGKVNEAGLAYYDSLVDELLKQGIEPYMTLYHWDLPFELQKRGGWLNPDSVQWFEDYTKVIISHFKGRVKNYFTINEMACILCLGYLTREHAPGWVVSKREAFLIWKNLLLAHGKAVRVIRSLSPESKIGFAACGSTYYPTFRGEKENGFTGAKVGTGVTKEDIEASVKLTFEVNTDDFRSLLFNLGLYSEPIMKGCLPKGLVERFGDHLPDFSKEELELISSEVDFFGLNIYQGSESEMTKDGPKEITYPEGMPMTTMGWHVTPDCLYWAPKFLAERYGKPVIITENGMSSSDWVSMDGKVHDGPRVDFLHRYLLALRRSAEDGTDVAGYFQWSLMDNFEWFFGYSKRFGIVYVDYETQKRVLKDSAYLFKDVIASNGDCL